MTPLAAYYVMIATEDSRKEFATPSYQVAPPMKTGRARLAAILYAFARPVRRMAGSAA